MASLYSRFGSFYSSSFNRRPWLTLAVANGTLGVIADGLAQGLEKQQSTSPKPDKGWDWSRSSRFLIFGIGMAPILAEWNKIIEYRLPLRASPVGKVSMAALAKRVAFDQIAFAPFGLVCFVGVMGALEYSGDLERIKGKFKDMYIPALLSNWKVWPAIQLINFSLVPLRFRVPFTSMCGIGWTGYLSLLAAARGPAESRKEVQLSS
ncbi:unnamed protein product [Sympodiomycopsis kandeliae]